MGLPLPRVVPDVGPGGGLTTALSGMNALQKQMLENKYFGPSKQSEIDYKNALTTGQNINNQYLPEKLRLANALAQLQNQYYAPNIQSEINLRNTQTARGNIENQYLPDKLRLANEYEKFKAANPLLSMTGPAGQIGALSYLQQNPQLFGGQQNQPITNYMPGAGGAPFRDGQSNAGAQQPTNNLADLLRSSIENQLLPKEATLSPDARLARDYGDVQAGFVPGSNRTQRYESQEAQNQALDLMGRKENELAWKTMPANAKMSLLAYANGAGIGVDEAAREFAKGTSLEDLYRKHGFDPKNAPDPDFLATQGNITKLKDRQAALKEMQVIDDFVKEGLGPYAQRIKGYSIKQIGEALTGMEPEKQAKFLAANSLVPELTGLRLMAANAKATVHAIKSMQDKSLMNARVFESLVTPKVWTRAQELIRDTLEEGLKKSTQTYSRQSGKKSKTNNATLRYNQETGEFEEVK